MVVFLVVVAAVMDFKPSMSRGKQPTEMPASSWRQSLDAIESDADQFVSVEPDGSAHEAFLEATEQAHRAGAEAAAALERQLAAAEQERADADAAARALERQLGLAQDQEGAEDAADQAMRAMCTCASGACPKSHPFKAYTARSNYNTLCAGCTRGQKCCCKDEEGKPPKEARLQGKELEDYLNSMKVEKLHTPEESARNVGDSYSHLAGYEQRQLGAIRLAHDPAIRFRPGVPSSWEPSERQVEAERVHIQEVERLAARAGGMLGTRANPLKPLRGAAPLSAGLPQTRPLPTGLSPPESELQEGGTQRSSRMAERIAELKRWADQNGME